MSLEELRMAALQLPYPDRADLTQSLTKSLLEEVEFQEEMDDFDREILARSDALHEGRLETVSLEEYRAILKSEFHEQRGEYVH